MAQIPMGEGRDVFARNSNGDLVHYNWTEAADWQHETRTAGSMALRIAGTPRPVYGYDSSGLRRASAFGRNSDGELIHYEWKQTAGWASPRNLTADLGGSPLATDPLPVVGWQGVHLRYDVFGRGLAGELVHYWYLEATNTWDEELIGGLPITGVPDVLVSYQNGDLRHDVFARNNHSQLVHYWWTAQSVWDDENLTTDYQGDPIFSDPEAIASYQKGSLRHDVFARGAGGALVHYWWTAQSGWDPDTRSGPAIEGKPDATVSSQGGQLRHDVFARGAVGALVQYWWTAQSGWSHTTANGPSITSDPVAVSQRQGSYLRLDVFARNFFGDLIHYWWHESTSADPLQGEPLPGTLVRGAIDVRAGTFGGYLRQDVFFRGPGDDLMVQTYLGQPPADWHPHNLSMDYSGPRIVGDPASVKTTIDFSDE